MSLSTVLVGCAKDRSFAPPADSEYVTVTVKVPPDFEAETMLVMYRSSVCKRRRSDSAGRPYEISGFNNMEIQPRRSGTTDLYEAKLAVDGGGQCQWRLSNVTFGIAHPHPIVHGADWFGGGGGVVVIFDENNSNRGGATFFADGDLIITKDYYPWIDEERLGQPAVSFSLFGSGYAYLMYKAATAKEIYFEPVVHSKYVLRSIGPKVKKDGNYTTFIYPDGSTFSNGKPASFARLEAIRHAAEASK
jgi:hypothetical protein